MRESSEEAKSIKKENPQVTKNVSQDLRPKAKKRVHFNLNRDAGPKSPECRKYGNQTNIAG